MQSRSTIGVLVSIKVLQLIGSVCCLVLHILQYTMGFNTPHITVFCGTYMGFTLVNMSFLISAVMGKPAAEELDMALGVIGGILFYICGILGMFFVRQQQIKDGQNNEMNGGDQVFFNMSRAQTMASLLTALIFVFDACLKFDMWNFERNKKKKNKLPDENEPPPLRLFCVDMCNFCYKKCRCCKCCNACCEKYCKCCRPKDEDSESEGSVATKQTSQVKATGAPTITVEKYPDNNESKENVVVQRVEIEWYSNPMGDVKQIFKKSKEKSLTTEDGVSVRNEVSVKESSFFLAQKMTWPLPLHSLIPSELAFTSNSAGAMQRLTKSSTLRTLPKTTRTVLSTPKNPLPPPDSAVPSVSDAPPGTSKQDQPSASTTPISIQATDDPQQKAGDDPENPTSREDERNLSNSSVCTSPNTQMNTSMVVRSRSMKKP